MPAEQRFLNEAVRLLRDAHLAKIAVTLADADDAQIWRRANAASNSIGNLLMHLAGNVRQHIVSGIGGASDARNRPLEFAARGGIDKTTLLSELENAVHEACEVIVRAQPILEEVRTIQGRVVVVLDDVFHVVEHFAYHTGQIVAMVKAKETHPDG